MIHLLASAQSTSGGTDLLPILLCLGAVAGAFLLILLPLGIAQKRSRQTVSALTALAIFWGLASVASALYVILGYFQKVREHQSILNNGYLDPAGSGVTPDWPWVLWGILAAVYVALIVWAMSVPKSRPRGEDREDTL
jgi:hypothetical protein